MKTRCTEKKAGGGRDGECIRNQPSKKHVSPQGLPGHACSHPTCPMPLAFRATPYSSVASALHLKQQHHSAISALQISQDPRHPTPPHSFGCFFCPAVVAKSQFAAITGRSFFFFTPSSFCGACLFFFYATFQRFCREKSSTVPHPRRNSWWVFQTARAETPFFLCDATSDCSTFEWRKVLLLRHNSFFTPE